MSRSKTSHNSRPLVAVQDKEIRHLVDFTYRTSLWFKLENLGAQAPLLSSMNQLFSWWTNRLIFHLLIQYVLQSKSMYLKGLWLQSYLQLNMVCWIELEWSCNNGKQDRLELILFFFSSKLTLALLIKIYFIPLWICPRDYRGLKRGKIAWKFYICIIHAASLTRSLHCAIFGTEKKSHQSEFFNKWIFT